MGQWDATIFGSGLECWPCVEVESSTIVPILEEIVHSLEANLESLQLLNNLEYMEVHDLGPMITKISKSRRKSININEVL
jgi:hypothetical protein